MDIATFVGVVTGFVLIAAAIYLGGGMGMFFNLPSIFITVGGTFSATLVHFPLGEVMKIFSIVRRTFTINIPEADVVIRDMVEFARILRRDGALALEAVIKEMRDDFLSKGLRLVIDGVPADQVHELMTIELNTLQRRHEIGASILSFMGAAAPAFGMIGTLIGLVQMLRDLTSPAGIGMGMATALLTTFYGALLANLLFIPLAGKLRTRSREELVIREMMIEGLVGIQSAATPSALQDRMTAYLVTPPETRG